MGISRVRSTVLTVSLAAAVAVAGCGGDDSTSGDGSGEAGKDPAAILQDVKRDLAKVKSMHLEAASKSEATTFAADVFASGETALDVTEGSSKARLLLLPTAVFIKGNRAYWESSGGSAVADKLSGRWVKAPVEMGKGLAGMVEYLAPKRLAECVDVGIGTLSVEGTDTVDGQEVVRVQDAGDKPGTSPGLLYVTTHAPHLPLRIVETGKSRPGGAVDRRCEPDDDDSSDGEVTLSKFDAVPEITVPKGALDLRDIAPQGDNSVA
jgi:hypothetical protein